MVVSAQEGPAPAGILWEAQALAPRHSAPPQDAFLRNAPPQRSVHVMAACLAMPRCAQVGLCRSSEMSAGADGVAQTRVKVEGCYWHLSGGTLPLLCML